MAQPVEVAVAVLVRQDGKVLLAQRPRNKVYSGYWEFPGGKIEPGESDLEALVREIREELGVIVERAYPWIKRRFVYPHATVSLNFFRVQAWRGELRPMEHQLFSWEDAGAVGVTPVLPANGPVLKALQLPHEYAITQAGALGVERFLDRLEARLAGGLRLVQVREKTLNRDDLGDFAARVIALCRRSGAKVLINTDIVLAHMVGADGVHLNSRQLAELPAKPDVEWCGVSCHTKEDLRRAEVLGADFAVLGPVCESPTHPGVSPLGWQEFRSRMEGAEIPVYAIGGMNREMLEEARMSGAHGVAMIRGSWADE